MSIYKQPGSPNWYYEFQVNGHRHRGSTGTTNQAKAKAAEAEAKKDAKKRAQHSIGKMTLAEALDRYDETVIKRGTSNGRNYAYQVKRLTDAFGDRTILDDITTERIADWRDRIVSSGKRAPLKGGKMHTMAATRTGLTIGSCNSYLKLLRTVLRAAFMEWKTLLRMPHVPMAGGRRAKTRDLPVPRHLTMAEENRLMLASPLYLQNFLRFLLDTGARSTEACTLVWDHVNNLESNAPATVTFKTDEDAGTKTKNGKERSIYLTDNVRELLIRIRRMQQANGHDTSPSGRVFLGMKRTHKLGPVESFESPFVYARRKAKLDKKVSLHTMRHTFACRLLMATRDLNVVKDALGHTDVKTTQIYAKLIDGALQDGMSKYQEYMASQRKAA
jgi:integrase